MWNKLQLPNPILLLLGIAAFVILYTEARATKVGFEQDLRQLTIINERTQAILASERVDKEALKDAVEAAEDLNGRLVAAVRLLIRKRDTLVVHDTVETLVLADSTRTATFKDSTFAGTIAGTITAPPCCGPLGLSYSITRPEFSPTIGFVQRGEEVAATVSWQGEEVEVLAPFARIPVVPPRFQLYGEGAVSTQATLRAALGAELRIRRQWYGFAAIQQDVPTNGSTLRGPEAWLGLRKRW